MAKFTDTAKTVLTVEYPNGGQRSVILVRRDFSAHTRWELFYRMRDANGKTYRVNDDTAHRAIADFDAMCNESQVKLAFIDDTEITRIKIWNRSYFV